MVCPYFTEKQKTLEGNEVNFCNAIGYKPEFRSNILGVVDKCCKTGSYHECGLYKSRQEAED